MQGLLIRLGVPILVFFVPLAVYLFTLSPGIAAGDSTEMVTAAIVLGVPHQPSYPVNTLLGYWGSRLPLVRPTLTGGRIELTQMGVVERVNAVAAFLQALTVVTFYFLVVEILGYVGEHGKRLVAFCASFFLAFSLIFWQYATKFEVFALNNLLAVLLLWMAVRIANKSARAAKPEGHRNEQELSRTTREKNSGVIPWLSRSSGLLLLSFLAGFAFTHHQTIILVFPAIGFLLFSSSGLSRFRGPNSDERSDLSVRPFGRLVSLVSISLILGMVPFFLLLVWIAGRQPQLNWGEVKDFQGAVAALTRRDFGTFQSFLVGEEPAVRQAPIEQLPYYLQWIVFDFSILGAVLAGLGVWFLWRRRRQLFWFVTLGLVMSGFIFLMYANFPLSDTFNQATVRRFMMLPNLFVALFLAAGLQWLYLLFDNIKTERFDRRLGIGIGKLMLVGSFGFPLAVNFSSADNRGNTLTSLYARNAYAPTPEDSLIMLSGDIPNMTVDFFRMVEAEGGDRRITFTPGQFHLAWFGPQLARKYPDLIVPPPLPGRRFTTATQIVDANYGRWPIFVGPDLVVHDPELEKNYTLYPTNLLFFVKKRGEDLGLEQWRAENDALWAKLDLQLVARLRKRSPQYEETVIAHYSRHWFNSGYVYEEVGLPEDAIREYERVLEIDPYFKEALAALARVYGEKLPQPDYVKAIEYLENYQSVLWREEGDYWLAAQEKIVEYQKKFTESASEEEVREEGQNSSGTSQEESEATASGEQE